VARHVIQIASQDGCVYVCDVDSGKLWKVCEVKGFSEMPVDVRETADLINLNLKAGKA
jgi:hypothetical protein